LWIEESGVEDVGCEEMNDESIPNIGNVWLLPGGGCRDCCEDIQEPELLSVLDTKGDGDGKAPGDIEEVPVGVCNTESPSDSGFSELLDFRVDFPASMPFFCLNFSSQLVLFVFKWLSLLLTAVAKNSAFSLIASSVKEAPSFCDFLTQFARALSMSGNLPLVCFTGERLRSSGKRYCSLFLRTLDTVLKITLLASGNEIGNEIYLRSTPNIAEIQLVKCFPTVEDVIIPPISVCFTEGFSS
jgi:hypothetical protein